MTEQEVMELTAKMAPELVLKVSNEILELLKKHTVESGLEPWQAIAVSEIVMARVVQLSIKAERVQEYLKMLPIVVNVIYAQLTPPEGPKQ